MPNIENITVLSGAPFSGAESLAARLDGHHISLTALCVSVDGLDRMTDPFIRYSLPASRDPELLAKYAANDANKSTSENIVISGCTNQQQIDAIYGLLVAEGTVTDSIYINPALCTLYRNYTNTWGKYKAPAEILSEVNQGQALAVELGIGEIAENTSQAFIQDYRSVACGALLLRTQLSCNAAQPLAS